MFAPAWVRRPSEEPGVAWKPPGKGFESRSVGVMPSTVLNQGVCVRNPKGPTVPCACCREMANILPNPARMDVFEETWYAKPKRGATLLVSIIYCERGCPLTPTKTRPPVRLENPGTLDARGEGA